MSKLNITLATAALLAFAACGDNDNDEVVLTAPEPVVETPAPVIEQPVIEQPVTEAIDAPEERAAEPARPAVMMGENGTPLMSDEMRYRSLDRGYTAEDFERMGVPINDDMYGEDRF